MPEVNKDTRAQSASSHHTAGEDEGAAEDQVFGVLHGFSWWSCGARVGVVEELRVNSALMNFIQEIY